MVFMSKKLESLFQRESKVYDLEEDNKIIIYQRAPVIIFEEGEKIWAWSSPENYRNILIK